MSIVYCGTVLGPDDNNLAKAKMRSCRRILNILDDHKHTKNRKYDSDVGMNSRDLYFIKDIQVGFFASLQRIVISVM